MTSLRQGRKFSDNDRLVVKGTADFIAKVRRRLELIAEVPLGRRLLESLSESGKTVVILFAPRASDIRPQNYEAAMAQDKMLIWLEKEQEKSIRGSGAGTGSFIKYNPDWIRTDGRSIWQRAESAILLAHELIHANDAAYGRMDPEEVDGIRNFERQAIGLQPFEQKEFTENKLRAEWPNFEPDAQLLMGATKPVVECQESAESGAAHISSLNSNIQ